MRNSHYSLHFGAVGSPANATWMMLRGSIYEALFLTYSSVRENELSLRLPERNPFLDLSKRAGKIQRQHKFRN